MFVLSWKSSSFRTLSNTGCFIASSIVILFLGSNTKVFMRKSYHYGRQYENISLGLFLSYFGNDFRYFRATSSSTKDISSGDGVPTNCNIFDLNQKIKVHLVIFRMRKSIFNLVSTVLITLWRRKRKTSLPLKQSPPGSSDLYLLVQFMLWYQFTHNATYRPHLNRGIIVCLHQDNLRSTVPSTHHMQS